MAAGLSAALDPTPAIEGAPLVGRLGLRGSICSFLGSETSRTRRCWWGSRRETRGLGCARCIDSRLEWGGRARLQPCQNVVLDIGCRLLILVGRHGFVCLGRREKQPRFDGGSSEWPSLGGFNSTLQTALAVIQTLAVARPRLVDLGKLAELLLAPALTVMSVKKIGKLRKSRQRTRQSACHPRGARPHRPRPCPRREC